MGLLLCAAGLLLIAVPASAKEVRFPEGIFGSVGQPSFTRPAGLAVDQGTGELYVLDTGKFETQRVKVSATAGTFRLKFKGETTADIPFSAPSGQATGKPGSVESALEALPSIGAGNVFVGAGPGDEEGTKPYRVIFEGALAHADVEQLTCENGSIPLSGGSGCSVTTEENGEPEQVTRWNADGTPSAFSALGSNAIDGIGPGEDQTPGNNLNEAKHVALDESGNATDGDIYVALGETHVLDVFAPSGKYLGQLTGFKEGSNAEGPPKLFSADSTNLICGVAVDRAGDLYVGETTISGTVHFTIHKYHPTSNPVANADNVANFPVSSLNTARCDLAAGTGPSAGYVFASGSAKGESPGVLKLNATTGAAQYALAIKNDEGKEEALQGVQAIAVDPASGNVLAGASREVLEYDASGSEPPLPRLTLSTGATGGFPGSLAIDATSGNLYVAREIPQLETYGPVLIVPDVTTEDATELTGISATLNGTISADNGPEAHCHFQYTTEAAYLTDKAIEGHDGFTGAQSAPCEPAGPFTAANTNQVAAKIIGLTPETFYRFRIVGENSNGSIPASDKPFETQGPPQIQGGAASQISTDSATISGEINPRGLATEYAVQYVTQAGFDKSGYATATTVPGTTKPTGSVFAPVSVALSGLAPATTYHFRFTASNESGAAIPGDDHTFTTYPEPPVFPPCANDALRTGAGASLPDCRAYEQVSPTDKNGADIVGRENFNQAAADGHAAAFTAYGELPSSGGNGQIASYVANRGPSGWSYDSALPIAATQNTSPIELGRDDQLRASLGVVTVPGGEVGLFDTDLTTFSRPQLLTAPANSGGFRNDPQFAADTAHFIFESPAVLTPDAADNGRDGQNLYDYDHGAISLAGRIPAFPATSCTDGGSPADDCTGPAGGSFAGSYQTQPAGDLSRGGGYKQDTISNDGARVFFTAAGTGRLYERLDGTQTVQLNADQGGNDPGGPKPASFLAASPDGSQVFFMSCERLTPDSTAVSTAADTCLTTSQGQDLYAYDTQSDQLTDLTVDPNAGDPQRAGVQGLLGASPDGSWVYFAANGDLHGAGAASAGNCDTSGAVRGSCSVYLYHAGQISFVARLGGTVNTPDFADWQPARDLGTGKFRTSRVASNGVLLFSSTRSLTGYDNIGPTCGNSFSGPVPGPCAELYRFDPAANSGAGQLDCVSCNPTGAPALSGANLQSDQSGGGKVALQTPALAILSRNLSASGDRVFFETPDKLLPSDTNGDGDCPVLSGSDPRTRACQDVYEWEASGSGSCHSASQNGGCLYLLSSGQSDQPSYLDDASASGDDVFIYTTDPLVPQDTDQLSDLYDVRVDGGLPSQHQAAPPSCDSPDQCRGPATIAPERQGAGSAVFQGPGNQPQPKPCPKGKVRKHGRCVKKHSGKKHHKKVHKRHPKSNRGASK